MNHGLEDFPCCSMKSQLKGKTVLRVLVKQTQILSGVMGEMNHRSDGYDEYFDPPLENKFECPICLLGVREPMQSPCGRIFCRGCILRKIR